MSTALTNANKMTAIETAQANITTTSDGVREIEIDGVKTSITTKGGVADILIPTVTVMDDMKNTVIGKHLLNINKYTGNVRTGLLGIGKELAEIKADGSYRDYNKCKSFEQFYKDVLGMKKATVYHYIGVYFLCCNDLGEVNPKALAVGDVAVNKAARCGVDRQNFQKLVEYADKENKTLTSDNLIEMIEKSGISYDKGKIETEKAKAAKGKKKVTVVPDIPANHFRFMQSKEIYIDFDKSKIKTNTDIEKAAMEYLNRTFTDNKYKDFRRTVKLIELSGHRLLVYAANKGLSGVLTEVIEKPTK